jgi:tRNA(fMet)-specific endonuclease VapC
MSRYVLDTDDISLAQRNHPGVAAKIRAIHPDEMAITIITAEEQLRGRFSQIRRSPSGLACVNAYHQLRETIDRLKTLTILDFDVAAELIDQSLRQRHPRMGKQDCRIAAITLANNCTLVTRNQTDFGQVVGLTLQGGVDHLVSRCPTYAIASAAPERVVAQRNAKAQ